MTPEERARRMLERLPLLMQSGPNLQRLFEAIGRELEGMERATRRLLESRWYTLARGFDVGRSLAEKASSDLGAIGALVGLHPGRGESATYFRRHMAELVRIHSSGGMSTARDVLSLVSFVYLAEQPPAVAWEDDVAIGRFRVLGEGGAPREIRVEVRDNPPSPASARIDGAEADQQLVTYNGGLDEVSPRIEIRASGGDVIVPRLRHEESGVDLIFLGTIAKNQTLTLRHELPPLLDGSPTDAPVVRANPTRFAGSATDARVFRFNMPESRFSFCEQSRRLPLLELGENRWTYATLSRSQLRAYIGDRAELARYEDSASESPSSPPIDIAFRWTEVTPAAFELRIPADYVPPHYNTRIGDRVERDMLAFFRDIQAALEYGRAAGVRATIVMPLPLEPEVLSIREGPPQVAIDAAFADEERIEDRLASVGPSVEFHETLAEPGDSFTFGGIFDETRFNGSGFS